MAPVSRRKSGSPTTRNAASAASSRAGSSSTGCPFATAERGGFARRDARSRGSRPRPMRRSIATLSSLRPAPVPPTVMTTSVCSSASARSSARTKITLAPCAETPREIASATASQPGTRDDAHARLAHAHARNADGLQRRHIDRAQPFAGAPQRTIRRGIRACASTPSPAVALACASAPVTASGGSTASASRGIAPPASTHAGADRAASAHRARHPRPARRAPPTRRQARPAPPGHGAVTATSSASTRPSASANATSRGATGRASAATRASTCRSASGSRCVASSCGICAGAARAWSSSADAI